MNSGQSSQNRPKLLFFYAKKYTTAELIFVTNITNYICGEKLATWRNFGKFGKFWEFFENISYVCVYISPLFLWSCSRSCLLAEHCGRTEAGRSPIQKPPQEKTNIEYGIAMVKTEGKMSLDSFMEISPRLTSWSSRSILHLLTSPLMPLLRWNFYFSWWFSDHNCLFLSRLGIRELF